MYRKLCPETLLWFPQEGMGEAKKEIELATLNNFFLFFFKNVVILKYLFIFIFGCSGS